MNNNYKDIFRIEYNGDEVFTYLKSKSFHYSLDEIIDIFLKIGEDIGEKEIRINISISWKHIDEYMPDITIYKYDEFGFGKTLLQFQTPFLKMEALETRDIISNRYSITTISYLVRYKARIKTINNLIDI